MAAMEGKTAVVTKTERMLDSPDLFQNITASKERYSQNSIESKILNILANGETDIDSLVRLLDHNANEINEAIVLMELSSDITRDGNIISKF